jgi:hypothetical protein
LVGKGVNLWDVTPASCLTVKQIKEIEDKEAELDRKARVELYAARGYAFETPEEGEAADEDDTPQDEWVAFFADDVPMTGGRCRRKGGVRDNASFEGFVDSAQ